MSARVQLMLLGALLAPLPLSAQGMPAPVADPQVNEAAAACGALAPLALIPVDVDAAFIATDIGRRIHETFQDDVAESVGSVAVGFAKGNGRLAGRLLAATALSALLPVADDAMAQWQGAARSHFRAILQKARDAVCAGGIREFRDTLSGMELKPVYIVMSIPDGQEEAVRTMLGRMWKHARLDGGQASDVEYVTHGKLTGFKYTFRKPEPLEGEPLQSPCDQALEGAVDDALAQHELYLLSGMEGKLAYLVICGNPDDISFAATPESSVLGTPAWRGIRADGLQAPLFAASCKHGVASAAGDVLQALARSAAPLAGAFAEMTEADAASAAVFRAAAEGIHTLAAQAEARSCPDVGPVTFQIWGTPGAYHAELACDAAGYTFSPAASALAGAAAQADTIFCMEASPLCRKGAPGGPPVCAPAAMAVFNGFAATLPPAQQEEIQQVMEFLPDAADACAALHTVWDGLGGAAGLVVDGKGVAPKHLFDGKKAAMPRLAFRMGVADRTKLAQGWEGLLSVAGNVVEKLGHDRDVVDMLPIVPSSLGNGATSYSVAIPGVLTPDFGANVSVSGSAFTAGSSAKLNRSLVSAGQDGPRLSGASFILRPAPLATVVRSMADNRPGSVDSIAETMENLAGMVESIQGRVSIEGGTAVFRLDINLTGSR